MFSEVIFKYDSNKVSQIQSHADAVRPSQPLPVRLSSDARSRRCVYLVKFSKLNLLLSRVDNKIHCSICVTSFLIIFSIVILRTKIAATDCLKRLIFSTVLI